MDIREKHPAVRGRGYGTNPERRSDALTVYQCRACVPLVAPCDSLEPPQSLDFSGCTDAQDQCIVGADVDNIADRHATSETHLRSRDRAPNAGPSATAKRASIDDSESSAM